MIEKRGMVMKAVFSHTAEVSLKIPPETDLPGRLPQAIYRWSGLPYACQRGQDGCFLRPQPHRLGYRNSFIPEISVTVTQQGEQTVLRLVGQPVEFVRIFMRVWFAIVFSFLLTILLTFAKTGAYTAAGILVPLGMAVFGYLMTRIGTAVPFRQVTEAIRKEFGGAS